jgi:hypothetical protein
VFEVGADQASEGLLEQVFTEERETEWVEFVAECAKFEAEVAHEVEINKLTLAELEEEGQTYERLRCWFRELRTRDLFRAPSAAEAERRLKQCGEIVEDFAERVSAARGQPWNRAVSSEIVALAAIPARQGTASAATKEPPARSQTTGRAKLARQARRGPRP